MKTFREYHEEVQQVNESEMVVDYVTELKKNEGFKEFLKKIKETSGKKEVIKEIQGPRGEMVLTWFKSKNGFDLDIEFGNRDNPGRPLSGAWTSMLKKYICKSIVKD